MYFLGAKMVSQKVLSNIDSDFYIIFIVCFLFLNYILWIYLFDNKQIAFENKFK